MAAWNDGTTDTVLSRLGEIMEVVRGIDGWPTIRRHSSGSPAPASNFDKVQDHVADEQVRRAMFAYAARVLIDRADEAVGLDNRTLADAIKVWYDQIVTDEDGFQFTITSPLANSGLATYGGSSTNPAQVAFFDRDRHANRTPFVYSETITAKCIESPNSHPSSRSSGEGLLHVYGRGSVPRTHRDWLPAAGPGALSTTGSGLSIRIPIAHGGQDGFMSPGKNTLTNGDMEDFTSNLPDQWTEITGTAGTTYTSNGSGLRGSNCLKIIGNGSELTELNQTFNDGTNGTIARLKPNTCYRCGYWVRVDATVAAGVLRVSIQDGSDNIHSVTPYSDADSAVSASQSTTLSGLTDDTWTYKFFDFVTPSDVEAGSQIRLELTTAITNTGVLLIDEVVVQELTHCYGPGLWVGAQAGAAEVLIDDSWTEAVTYHTDNDEQDDLIFHLFRLFDWEALNRNQQNARYPITLPVGKTGAGAVYTNSSYLAGT